MANPSAETNCTCVWEGDELKQLCRACLEPLPSKDEVWIPCERVGQIEVREYRHGDQARQEISISEADMNLPTLVGGFIARNPDNHADQWYIAREYFNKHYQIAPSETSKPQYAIIGEIEELDDGLGTKFFAWANSKDHLPVGTKFYIRIDSNAQKTSSLLNAVGPEGCRAPGHNCYFPQCECPVPRNEP